MLKLRFPALQNPKLSRQGIKYPCFYFTHQRGGQINCLNFEGTLSQDKLITKIDAELVKAGLDHQAAPAGDAA